MASFAAKDLIMPDLSKHRQKTSQIVKKVGDKALDLQTSSTKHVDKYVRKRTKNIAGLRRFMISWLALVILLCVVTMGSLVQLLAAARTAAPVDDGAYTEGMVGTLSNLNPLFGSGALDDSASRLMFNGLLRYDTNGTLTSDLAQQWQVGEDRKTYNVTLKKDVQWHDGQPFTAADVVFTIQAIQNPQTRSSLFSSWQGIKVSAASKYEVKFELPASFAPFPGALTVPILPKHLLEDITPEHLRSTSFNNQPVGTGPFAFTALRSEQGSQQLLELSRNEGYFRGAPRLERFIIHTYPDDEAMANALRQREITAAVDLKKDSVDSFVGDTSIRLSEIPLNSGVFGFFKTTAPALADANIRTALVNAVDRQTVLELFSARYAPLKTPLLQSQLGFDGSYQQVTNRKEAERLLDAAGWARQKDGSRARDGAQLELSLVTVNNPQYTALAKELQKQWASVGVSVKPQLLSAEQLQQTALSAHSYDILLYGISLGYDPDVYAYWHSSQARPSGLNFSEWKSDRADVSLDVARTRLEAVLREARYKTFQDEWLKSSPAVALYQPRVNYAYHQNARGFVPFNANSASDRLTNVEDWTVNTVRVNRTP